MTVPMFTSVSTYLSQDLYLFKIKRFPYVLMLMGCNTTVLVTALVSKDCLKFCQHLWNTRPKGLG